jgi:ubiquinone/menaquinone biosynthesis C-methylase UbiE
VWYRLSVGIDEREMSIVDRNKPVEYMHGVGDAEQRRLEVQAELLGGAAFLPTLRPNMTVLEVGCGPGAMARRVARQIAPGEYVGVDREARYLETAGRAAAADRLTNTRFVRGDAERLEELDLGGPFDGAYCRFVLEHTPAPVVVIRQLAEQVRPGGWICAYEWQNASFVVHPECPTVRRVWSGIDRLQETLEGDCNVAPKLLGMFQEAGLADVRIRADAFAFTNQDDRLRRYVDGAREIIGQTRASLLERDLVGESELAQADGEYAALLDNRAAVVVEVMCCATGVVG